MKKGLLINVFAMASMSVLGANDAPVAQWGNLFGGSTSSGDQSVAIAINNDGNILWMNTANTDASSAEVFYNNAEIYSNPVKTNNLTLLYTDADGILKWNLHSTNSDIASNQGNVAVMPDGNIIFSAKIRQIDDVNKLNFVDAAGDVSEFGKVSEKKYYSLVLAKVTSDGNLAWTKVFEPSTAPAPAASGNNADFTSDAISSTALAIDDDGNIYVGGNYCSALTIDDCTLEPTNVSSWSGDAQTTCGNMFLVKLDKDGNYLGSAIGEGDINGLSQLQSLVWNEGKLYVYGYAKGSGSFNFAGVALSPSDVNSPIVGCLNADLTAEWLKCFKGETIDGKSALQNVGISIYGDNLWLAGQFNQKILDPDNSEDFVTATQGSMREGFIIKLDKTNGQWLGSADSRVDFPSITKLGGYYKVIQNTNNLEKAYVYGYTMDATQGIFLREYNALTLQPNVDHAWNIATGGGVPTCIASAYDQENHALYITGRGNKAFTLMGDPDIVTDATKAWDVLMAKYSIPADESTSIGIAESESDSSEIYDIFGRFVGNTMQDLNPGIYISGNKKFIVR